MDVGVCRAFFVAKSAEDMAKAVEARLANQKRLARLATDPSGKTQSSMLTFAETLDAAAESAMYGTPDDIAKKLGVLRSAGIERILLTGPVGSRENLRAFARDVMPAFSGRVGERPRSKPALVRDPAVLPDAVSRRSV